MKMRFALGLLVALCLAGCTSEWRASVELGPAPTGAPPLAVKLKSALGDELVSSLGSRCVNVSISQSPKLPNRIAITIVDRNGTVLGRAMTHDLAGQPFTIPLDGGGTVTVSPGRLCDRI